MVVITSNQHAEICQFIRTFNGLAIDCEKELKQKYAHINAKTLSSIISRQYQQRIKLAHPRLIANAEKLLNQFKNNVYQTGDPWILLRMSIEEKCSPIGLCRILLNEQYKSYKKSEITEMLRNPHVIPCKLFAINVSNCLFNDCRDGSIPDIIKQCVGEEYEIRCKELATKLGLVYYDEGDLRRTGFDKTPDLKLAIPCLYKGKTINWIESKASFGDWESHLKYIRDQLASYVNRFGAGLVIYWFGYLDEIADCRQNGETIFVCDDFPPVDDFELIKVCDGPS